VVDRQLKCRGSNTPGVLGAAGLATKLVLFHLNGGLPEQMVATGRGVGDSVGESHPVQWKTSHAELEHVLSLVKVVVFLPVIERSLACMRLLESCQLDFVKALWGVL
jgi:hypothetical protein